MKGLHQIHISNSLQKQKKLQVEKCFEVMLGDQIQIGAIDFLHKIHQMLMSSRILNSILKNNWISYSFLDIS